MKPALMEQLVKSYLNHRFPPEKSSEKQGKHLTSLPLQQGQPGDEVDSPLVKDNACSADDDCNHINLIAARLVKMADDYQRSHETKISKRRASEADDAESQSLSVTVVANSLSRSLNPENFKKALHSVCQQATSLPLEAALALELTAHVYRIIGFRNSDFIPNAVAQYFGSRISMEDLEKIDSCEEPM